LRIVITITLELNFTGHYITILFESMALQNSYKTRIHIHIVQILQLPSALLWRCDENFSSIYQNHLKFLNSFLGYTLYNICKNIPHEGSTLIKEMDKLNQESYLRILSAPLTYFHLNIEENKMNLKRQLSFLEDSVISEKCRCKMLERSPKNLWSVLGDYYIPSNILTSTNPVKNLIFDHKKEYFSPKIENTIVIDYWSMHTIGNIPWTNKISLEFEQNEICKILEKLYQTVKIISSVNYDLLKFILMYTKVLLLVKDRNANNSFEWSSESEDHYIGQTVLTNPHLEQVMPLDIAEALVHEAIHHMIYMIEIREYFLQNDPDIEKYIESPWTGTKLHIHNYLHACFVWYGLLNFWKDAEYKIGYNKIKKYKQESLSGFKRESIVENIKMIYPKVPPSLLETIQKIQLSALNENL
jgi:hypothetical protein